MPKPALLKRFVKRGSIITDPPFGQASSVTYTAPSGSANNIVFTFDQAYPVGQYANGDWWVAPLANGGTVTITSITPNATGAGAAARNGFVVNKTSFTQQAFDGRAQRAYNAALMPALPLTINTTTTPTSSVVKAVSMVTPTQASLKFAAVLTVVSEPVANSSKLFRPGYFGATGKTSYAVPSPTTIAGTQLGKHKPTAAQIPAWAGYSIASIATRYANVWMDLSWGWQARSLHPEDNMPDYGASIQNEHSKAMLRMLLSDFDYSISTHKQALINYLQMTIDLKSVAANGGEWGADGGHSSGRKMPMQFAHLVFGGSDFNYANNTNMFAENHHIYRSSVTGEVLYGRAESEYQSWKDTIWNVQGLGDNGGKDVRDFYGRIDGSGWRVGTELTYQVGLQDRPWRYEVLAQYMLGIETPPASLPLPGTNILVEYVERMRNHGVKASDTITNINLTTKAVTSTVQGLPIPARPVVPSNAVYGTHYGPSSGVDGNAVIIGTNTWADRDGSWRNFVAFNFAIGDQLWAWYRP